MGSDRCDDPERRSDPTERTGLRADDRRWLGSHDEPSERELERGIVGPGDATEATNLPGVERGERDPVPFDV